MRNLRDQEKRSKEPLTRSLKIRLAIFAALSIILLCASIFRPDGLYFLHFWSLILWTPVLLLPFVTMRPRDGWKPKLIALAAWVMAVLLMREPGLGVVLPPSPKPSGALRVVVPNCAGGESRAVKEALKMDADVWLLQETTGPRSMRRLLHEVDSSLQLVADIDACIVARTGLVESPKRGNSASADFSWNGMSTRLVSLRLMPPTFRLDWWSPEAHRAYQQDMRDRRHQLAEILEGAKVLDNALGVVAGDFNSTNRPAFSAMMPGWHEADLAAGRGWPGTGTNDYPLARVDQIWTSPRIRVHQSFVVKTQYSDHRMVVADLMIDP